MSSMIIITGKTSNMTNNQTTSALANSMGDKQICEDVGQQNIRGSNFENNESLNSTTEPTSETSKEELSVLEADRHLLKFNWTITSCVTKSNVLELVLPRNMLMTPGVDSFKRKLDKQLKKCPDEPRCSAIGLYIDMHASFKPEQKLHKTTVEHSGITVEHSGKDVSDWNFLEPQWNIQEPQWNIQGGGHLERMLVITTVEYSGTTVEHSGGTFRVWDFERELALKQYFVPTREYYLAESFVLQIIINTQFLLYDISQIFCQSSNHHCQSILLLPIISAEEFFSIDVCTAVRSTPHHGHHKNEKYLGSFDVIAQEKEDFSHYNLSRPVLNENIHSSQANLEFPHATSTVHAQTSEDSVEGSSSLEDKTNHSVSENHTHFDKSGISENHSHFPQLTVWHQDSNVYTQEESLSSDSSHLYPRQFYGQGFEVKGDSSTETYNTRIDMKGGSSESYNNRLGSQQMYSSRESLSKSKTGFSSAMSYYVSNYNPDNDVTISDDQSTQSFQCDEGINQGINFYSSRTADGKDSTHILLETENQNEGAYSKSYYLDNSSTYQDQTVNCRQQDIYYNDNSSDTQVSNCPQDMTIQHQFSHTAVLKEQSETQFTHLNDKENSESQFITSDKNDFVTQFSHQDSQSQFCSQNSMISNRLDNFEEDTASHNLSIITEDSVDTSHDTERQNNPSIDIQSYSHYFSSNCNLGDGEIRENQNIEKPRELFALELSEVKRSYAEGKVIEQDLENNLDDPDDPGCVLDDLCTPDPLDGNTPRQVQFKINRGFLSSNISQSSELEKHSTANAMGKGQLTSISQHSVSEHKVGNVENNNNNNDDVRYVLISNDSNINIKDDPENPNENHRRISGRVQKDKEEKCIESASIEINQRICDICDATFKIKKEYFNHMKEHFPGPPHHCDTCTSAFQRIYHLLDHRTLHQDLRPFKCTICNFSANRKFNLQEHMTLHKENRKFKCKTCGEQFARLQVLNTHETKHSNDRPFLCETCGWSGKTKHALIIHNKKHTGDLMTCKFSDCGYTTAKTSHLKEHMARHSNIRKFVCTQCCREFLTQSKLSRHLLTHNPEKPFKCSLCDCRYTRKDHLGTHMKKKHTKRTTVKKPPRKKQEKKKDSSHLDELKICKTNNKPKTRTRKRKCQQKKMFSDVENSNVSLQPQIPCTPPPTTLSEYPHSPTQYSNFPHSSHHNPDDPLMMGQLPDAWVLRQSPDDKTHAAWGLGAVSGMSPVTDALPSLQQSPPLHRGLGPSLTYQDPYHSPSYQTSPTSHFEALSPHSSLPYSNGQHSDESPLNFASYMKYN
ncbi:unnamed protein product, partial [Meganyctiphanes norvegica]